MRPSGFDYLRIFLALSVMVMHATSTTYGQAADLILLASPWRPFIRAVVPAFFVLSGFLVCGSLNRCRTLVTFVGLRVIRIYPALGVEVLISAIIMGPIVTTQSLAEYLSAPEFLRYLLNVTGHISYSLPGVFEENPFSGIVNGQLWTVPYELYCYIVLTTISLFGIVRRRIFALLFTILFMATHLLARLIKHDWQYEPIVGAPPGPLLIAYFLAGIVFYQYRDETPAHPGWAVAATVGSVVSLAVLPLGEYLAIPLLGYLTVYLGTANPPRSLVTKAADYSYGVYLYGFVVQQTVMAAFPDLRTPYWNLAIAMPLAVVLAAASWHFIELPAMALKPGLKRLEEHWLQVVARTTARARQ